MRKILLSVSSLLFTVAVAAQTEIKKDTLAGNWAVLSGGPGMDMVGQISSNDENEIFFTQDFYSSETNLWTAYNGEKFNGYPSKSSIQVNGNACFIMHKINSAGERLLTVHSDYGYFDRSSSSMVATSDGGVLLALKMRLADKGPDADGKKIMLNLHTSADDSYVYTIEEKDLPVDGEYGWIYKGYILKLDKDGKVEWCKNVWADYKPVEVNKTSKTCSNMFDFNGAVEGPDGNFYIAGKFARPLNIEGTDKVFEPDNVPENWNYDYVQNPAGDLFLLKLDAEGNYKWTMTHKDGSFVNLENPVNLAADDEAVYLMGYMEGSSTEEQTTTFGDKEVQVPSERSHLFYIKVNCETNSNATDETVAVEYAKLLNGTKDAAGRQRIKPMFVEVTGGKIILGGSFTGSINNGDTEILKNSVTTNTLHGYVITASAQTGNFEAAKENYYKLGISETESAHLVGDSIYVSGYTMSSGGWLVSMHKETLTEGTYYQLFTGGGASTVQGGALVEGNKYIMFGRGRTTPFVVKDLEPLSSTENSWDALVCGFTLPDVEIPTRVNSAVSDTDTFVAYASQGKIVIKTVESCQVNIYNAAGRLMKSFCAESGDMTIDMPQGFYIVNGKKVVVY